MSDENKRLGPVPTPDPELAAKLAELPKIDADDKLTFRTMEAEIYRAQIELQNGQNKVNDSLRAINEFLKTIHEKYGVDQKEATVDAKRIEFIAKAQESK